MQVRLLIGDGRGAPHALTLSESSNRYEINDYQDVPSGINTVEVTSPDGARKSLPFYLPDGGSGTLLVQADADGIHVAFFDDRVSTDDTGTKSFNVFNLLQGSRGEAQVSLGDVASAHVLSPGGRLRLYGVKAALYPITINGTDGDGKSFRWSGETDLRKVRRATLLICPDVYGRIRPRLIEDGTSADAPSKNDGQ